MLKTLMIRSALIAFACALSVAAHAYASDPKRFDVPAGDLTAALETLAKQSGLELVYQSEQVKGLRTKGITGNFTPEEAVTKLLENTPLTFRKDASGAMLIAPPKSSLSTSGESEVAAAREGGAFLAPGTAAAPDSRTEKKGWFERFRLAQNDQDQPSSSSSKDEADTETLRKDSDEQMGEVIVTAQKRDERLQDVPISISVVAGVDLDRSSVMGMTEALGRVPGVSVNEFFTGAQVPVRGVAAGLATFTGSSPTAFYLDSVPFGFVKTAIGPDPDVYDLARIEVLRGPQGTLYGSSALNGVVRVLTQDANLDVWEFKARTSVSSTEHGGENYRGDMAVNVPIIDGKLAARAVVGYQNLSGWIDKPNNEDANDAERTNMRLKINAQPTEQLSIGLSAWLSRADYGATSFGAAFDQNSSPVEEPSSVDYDAFGLNLGYELPGFSITSVTSYLDYSNNLIVSAAATGPVFLETKLEANTFAEEIVLRSTHEGPWRWSLGGMYRDSEDSVYQFIPGQFVAPNRQTFTSESSAVFGELTRTFLDGRLGLTGGLRYFEDDVGLREHSRPTGVPAAQLVSDDYSFDALTPRVVLTVNSSKQLTAYASYSEGFRSGTPQAPSVLALAPIPPAEPDTLKNYELGLKGSSLLNERINFDAALYYIDWKDVQQSISVMQNIGGVDRGLAATINSESASGLGFEVAVTVAPVEPLELGVTFSWNDLTADSDVVTFPTGGPATGVILFSKGDRLNYSPEFTAGASADYVFPLGGNGAEGRFSAAANYTSEQCLTQLAGTVVSTACGDDMLIARTSVSIRTANRWTATLFVDNVNDERDSSARSPAGPHRDVHVRPRTMGIQFEYRY